MNRYTLTFTGRLKGAIGIFERHSIQVQAVTPSDALARAYDTHEHIQNIRMSVYKDRTEYAVHPREYGRS